MQKHKKAFWGELGGPKVEDFGTYRNLYLIEPPDCPQGPCVYTFCIQHSTFYTFCCSRRGMNHCDLPWGLRGGRFLLSGERVAHHRASPRVFALQSLSRCVQPLLVEALYGFTHLALVSLGGDSFLLAESSEISQQGSPG